MTPFEIVLATGISALVYLWVSNRLNAQMDVYRDELADVTSELLESTELSEKLQTRVEYISSNAFSMYLAWSYAIALPVALVFVGFQRFVLRKPSPARTVPPSLEPLFGNFVRLSMLVIIGNSVLTFVIGAIAFTIARLTLIPFLAVASSVERWSDRVAHMENDNHKYSH